jgi:hypothetical protein
MAYSTAFRRIALRNNAVRPEGGARVAGTLPMVQISGRHLLIFLKIRKAHMVFFAAVFLEDTGV